MTDVLPVGLAGQAAHTVTADMAPPHLPVPVLSTPSMILLIEQSCLLGVQPELDENATTVGTHVCVSHQAAASPDEEIMVDWAVAKVERRRVTFDIRVTCGDRILSEGTHQRAVIDTTRFS